MLLLVDNIQMTQYIVLNGPPRSGRSTLAKLLHDRIKGSVRAELHAPLKHLFCSALAMKWEAINNDRSRAVLNGRSSVDALRQLATSQGLVRSRRARSLARVPSLRHHP